MESHKAQIFDPLENTERYFRGRDRNFRLLETRHVVGFADVPSS